MADFLKIIQVGSEVLNRVQDNVGKALPARSDITSGFLVENASLSGTINHRLGRQALGAIVVKQSDDTNPVIVTGLSATTITVAGTATGTASFWVF